MKTDISIIIPVYNVARYITECLESVAAQTAAYRIGIECLLIDDCGKDNSMEIVEKFVGSYDGPIDFRILRHDRNRGLSEARNTGIDAARGSYMYFLDSDDYISRDCMQLLWECVVAHPGVDIVYGNVVCTPDPRLKAEYLNQHKPVPANYIDDITTLRHLHLTIPEIAWNRLFRVDFFKNLGLRFLPGIIHEDLHMHILLYPHVRSCAFIATDAPTYFYRMRPDSITNDATDANARFSPTNYGVFDDLLDHIDYFDRNLTHLLTLFATGFKQAGKKDIERRKAYLMMRRKLGRAKWMPWGFRLAHRLLLRLPLSQDRALGLNARLSSLFRKHFKWQY